MQGINITWQIYKAIQQFRNDIKLLNTNINCCKSEIMQHFGLSIYHSLTILRSLDILTIVMSDGCPYSLLNQEA